MEPASNSITSGDSEDDFDWEEVEVPVNNEQQMLISAYGDLEESPPTTVKPNIEITIQARKKPDEAAKERNKALYAQRLARLHSHKIHTIALLANGRVRNRWLNDPLLHARLMSLCPIALQNAFAMIHKSRFPDPVKRGRLFESAMTRLVEWWSQYFRLEQTGHIRSKTFEDVQQRIAAKVQDRKGKGRARDESDDSDGEEEGEVIRSEKSLMKHALMRRGSRDTSAQLFTALCRALGIPARLVVSLQSVPWQARVGKPKVFGKKADVKGSDRINNSSKGSGNDDMETQEVSMASTPEIDGKGKGKIDQSFPGDGRRLDGTSAPNIPDKGKQKASPVIKLRQNRGRKLGSAPAEQPTRREFTPDPTATPPVFWTEVFSRPDGRWLPVDPIRAIVNKRKVFDPSTPPSAGPVKSNIRVENRLVYVVAFEEDGYARDVTPRYAREYGAKVAKAQQGGRGKRQWWEGVMSLVTRPYRLNRDDLEDEELHINQMTEQMPSSMAGFKNHPLYVLARHLKRDEVIHPLVELGKFRGEPVYPRSSVLSLKTAENWMRQGRKVRESCQPMKWVKQNAMTVNRKRELEFVREGMGGGPSGGGDVMQGLYAESQTEVYRPPAVVDGKIPKNNFGNIDLYVPSMLPEGAAYIPYKGTAKIARQLGFDYAEAVTGFEFKKQRATPVIQGIVVAEENKEVLLEAYREAELEAAEKRRTKRHEQVLKRWTRLVQGLRIRQRLQEQYTNGSIGVQNPENHGEEQKAAELAGGFLTLADEVVQPYSLPKNLHPQLSSLTAMGDTTNTYDEEQETSAPFPPGVIDLGLSQEQEQEMEVVEHLHDVPDRTLPRGIPKTMRELAQDAERQHAQAVQEDLNEEIKPSSPVQAPGISDVASSNGIRNGNPRASRRKRGKTGAVTAPLRQSPEKRGRKRAREDDLTSEEDQEVSEETEPVPSKRSRMAAKTPIGIVPKSDRVLRSRAPKSASKLQEEEEQEEAFRQAIAG